jgi:hypothetical protein
MDRRAKEINDFYGYGTPDDSSARTESARNAANARWKDRGGPTTTIRVGVAVAERLNAEIPQPERRPFVENAITTALDKRPSQSGDSDSSVDVP